MKTSVRILIVALIALTLPHYALSQTRQDSIQNALEYQLKHYPASQYRDVYKNFMQDYFGPGHLLNDTVAASKYLKAELAGTSEFGGPLYEPTGFSGNFYRVNLSLINDGTVSYPVYFNAFIESVQSIVPPSNNEWSHIWQEIDAVIRGMNLSFKNYQNDKRDIIDLLSKGQTVVHHSDAYNESVNFHYRIISREQFDRVIRPLIEQPK